MLYLIITKNFEIVNSIQLYRELKTDAKVPTSYQKNSILFLSTNFMDRLVFSNDKWSSIADGTSVPNLKRIFQKLDCLIFLTIKKSRIDVANHTKMI